MKALIVVPSCDAGLIADQCGVNQDISSARGLVHFCCGHAHRLCFDVRAEGNTDSEIKLM